MERNAVLDRLICMLCSERGEAVPALRKENKPDFFRALCNIRPPLPVSEEFLSLQDEYLSQRSKEAGVVDAAGFDYRGGVALWRGDITRLRCDGIVNAANSSLLGCFVPCHGCVDNAIHTCAGVQLRLECARIMAGQSRGEPTGRARITPAYNLPSAYILHTVGPVVRGRLTAKHRAELASCYSSCLELARGHKLGTLAFCCISTGEFGFPAEEAAEIAVATVDDFLRGNGGPKVIFNVFKETDYEIYARLLAERG